jgi:two-component system chemotaxis response regulator CheY
MTQADISVLVVDDVNSMRVQIKELLKQFGFRNIRLEENIEKAKLAIEMEKFHLILCDWHLGSGTGLDFLMYVRAHPDYGQTAFIMVTAEGTKEMVVAAVKAGVDDYLLKPLTMAQIQNKVYGTLLKKKVLA